MSGNNMGASSALAQAREFKHASPNSEWLKAIQWGNCVEVMRLLRQDSTRLEQTGYRGRTALHAAVIGGWEEVTVKELLRMCHGDQQKVSLQNLLDAVDGQYQQTALGIAVVVGSARVVRTILRAYGRDEEDEDESDEGEDDGRHAERDEDDANHESDASRKPIHGRQQVNVEQQRLQLRDIIYQLSTRFSKEDPKLFVLLNYHCSQVRHCNEKEKGDEYVLHSICHTNKREIESNIQHSHDGSRSESEVLLRLVEKKMEKELNNLQNKIMKIIVEEAERVDPSLVRFLFELQDNMGMTPLHAVVRKGPSDKVAYVLALIPTGEGFSQCVNALDSAGRTPLHVAAAQSGYPHANKTLKILLDDTRTDVNARFNPLKSFSLQKYELGKLKNLVLTRNNEDFKYYLEDLTALHLAVLHKQHDRLKILLQKDKVYNMPVAKKVLMPRYFRGSGSAKQAAPSSWLNWDKFNRMCNTPMWIAIVMGHEASLQLLLQDDKVYDGGRIENTSQPPTTTSSMHDGEIIENKSQSPNASSRVNDGGRKKKSNSRNLCLPALHMAACCGYPEIVKIILDQKYFDPMVTDEYDHNALHWAADAFMMDGHFISFHWPAVTDCVDLRSLEKIRYENKGEKIFRGYSGKKACINLLLQNGFDIWAKGKYGNTPTPGLSAPEEYYLWWYDKLENATKDTKSNLIAAANAISVTAALVATASFIGPVQPPLGYQDGPSLYYELSSVNMFIVCDSLSFYLAMTSIMLSLIPSLPIQQAPMRSELQRTQKIIIGASCLLLASITCMILSFAGAAITVLPSAWSHRVSTFSTTMLGGTIFFVVLYFFALRLVRIVFHYHHNIRRPYDGLAEFKWHLFLNDLMNLLKRDYIASH